MIRIKSILVAVLLISFVSALSAQNDKFVINLKKIEVRLEDSPTFPDQLDSKNTGNVKKWAAIFVEYETKFADIKMPKGSLDDGKWLDSIEVTWDILYKPAKAPNVFASYIRFGKSIKYVNIDEGKHKAVLLIDPKVLKRYFNEGKTIKNELMMKVSFKANGYKKDMLIGRAKYASAYFNEGKLVKDPKALINNFNTDRIKVLKGATRSKAESPFSAIQFDLFDTIAVEEK